MNAKPRQPAVTKSAGAAKASKVLASKAAANSRATQPLLVDLRDLILETRLPVSRTVNSGLILLYWHIGTRIRRDLLQETRAEYRARMVQAGAAQLSWTHLVEIIRIDDPLKRDFYTEMCRVERWSTRTLAAKISGMLFERSAVSKKPAKLAEMELKALRKEDRLTPDLVFRDPYFLDFLGLKNTYAESDLEAAILREMKAFILELGAGFAFMQGQKRMAVDGVDHYSDLLFYHRNLRRLVAVELKLGDFKAGDKGQMELYPGWLDRYERQKGEEAPIGLILCAGKQQETIGLPDLERSGIKASSYRTEALPKAEMERKLHKAVALARTRLQINMR